LQTESTKQIDKIRTNEGRNMQKLTVFEKKETGSKKESDMPDRESSEPLLKSTSNSSNKSDSIEIGVIGTEKTERMDQEENRTESLPCDFSQQKMFDDYLFEAIDEVLTSLGEPVKNTLYFQLENSFNIPKNEIPMQIDQFTDIIHKIFGLGASRLEIKFMKILNSKIKVKSEFPDSELIQSKWIVDDMSFTECVQNMRKNYYNPVIRSRGE
jgi:hypothetical protein